MNRVFLTGRVKGPTHVLHTPEGHKITKFVLRTDEEDIELEVYYKGREQVLSDGRKPHLMVFGSLARALERGLVIRAQEIICMED
jgi:hypothetical protein